MTYQIDTPSSGGTVVVASGVTNEIIKGSSVLSSLTTTFPSFPNDGDIFELSSHIEIQSMTTDTSDGSAIAPPTFGRYWNTTLPVGKKWLYNMGGNTWEAVA